MRRAVLLLAATTAALVVVSGVALAAVISCGGSSLDNPCFGTYGGDVMTGTNHPDTIIGEPGDDVVDGGDGNDGRNRKFLDGRGSVDGGPGADIVKGGPGNDTLFDGDNPRGKTDIVLGGDGNDVLLTNNTVPTKDILHCGRGRDTVYGDRADIIADDCEKVFFRDAPPGSFHEF